MIKKYGFLILIGALSLQSESFSQSRLQNYVFFNLDRERIQEAGFPRIRAGLFAIGYEV
jgi:hypothetical protein